MADFTTIAVRTPFFLDRNMSSRLASGVALLSLALAVAAGAMLVRAQLRAWTHERVAAQLSQRLTSLPDQRAARLVRQLAAADDEWLTVLVPAMSDPRPPVAAAAASEIELLVDRWSSLPAAESWPRAQSLAHHLAQHSRRIPIDRIRRAQSLAQQLLDWSADNRHADAARHIANCEAVLRLTPAESDDIRVAAAR